MIGKAYLIFMTHEGFITINIGYSFPSGFTPLLDKDIDLLNHIPNIIQYFLRLPAIRKAGNAIDFLEVENCG